MIHYKKEEEKEEEEKKQGRKRNIFPVDKVIFPDFLPGVKCFFPVGNSHFGTRKTNFSGFENWKEKKKKKKKKNNNNNNNLFLLPFSMFRLLFSDFLSLLPHFYFFLCLSFPGRSAEISQSEVGGHSACLPPPVMPLKKKRKKEKKKHLWFDVMLPDDCNWCHCLRSAGLFS